MLCMLCSQVFQDLTSDRSGREVLLITDQTLSHVFDNRESCSFCARFWFRVRATSRVLRTDHEIRQLYSSVFDEELSVDAQFLSDASKLRIRFRLVDVEELAPGLATSFQFNLVPTLCAPTVSAPYRPPPSQEKGASIVSLQMTERARKAAFYVSVPYIKRWLERTATQSFSQLFGRGSSKDDRVPTRLIRIGDGEGQRLVHTATLASRGIVYATLSHCWGGQIYDTLTSDNQARLEESIPDSMLTLTFMDAVEVCRVFGIKFLWVDSLCIIQDSEDDWTRESSRMHFVYGSSVLNIAATASQNGTEGLFRVHNPALFTPCQVKAGKGMWLEDVASAHQVQPGAKKLPLAERQSIVADRLLSIHRQALEASPLLTRGWVVQEIFLAPRTLHFAETQIWWCSKDHGCFSQLSPEVPLASMQNSRLMYSWETFRTLMPDAIADSKYDPESLDDFWDQIVEDYSGTDLTKHDDRIVALSGMAKVFQAVYDAIGLRTGYVAGMWRHRMLERLFWVAARRAGDPKNMSNPSSNVDDLPDIDGRSDIPVEQTHADPLRYSKLAPSWSWMSFNGPVRFGTKREKVDSLTNTETTRAYEVTVIDLKMDHLHPHDGSGRTSNCSLVLRGPVIPCLIHYITHDTGSVSFPLSTGQTKYALNPCPALTEAYGADWIRFRVMLDPHVTTGTSYECKLLLLSQSKHGRHDLNFGFCGFILHEQKGHPSPSLRRIGLWNFGTSDTVRPAGENTGSEYYLRQAEVSQFNQSRSRPLVTERNCCIESLIIEAKLSPQEITIN